MTEPSKPHRRKETRPTEIIEAAIGVFIEQGFGGASVNEIAKRANSAKGTVYLYFETKEKLFESVVRHYIQPTRANIASMIKEFTGSTSDLLERMIRTIYSEMVSNDVRRGIMRILIAEGHRFPHLTNFYYNDFLSKAEEMIMQIIKRGMKSGEFRDSPVQKNPKIIMGPAIMASIWKMSFDTASPIDLNAFADAHVDLILNGLKA